MTPRPWWPPKVGDKLRCRALGSDPPTLVHVVAVYYAVEREHGAWIDIGGEA